LQITAYFRAARGTGDTGTAHSVAEQIRGTYPILFLVVGLVVLFLRVENRNAWLLAALCLVYRGGRFAERFRVRTASRFPSRLPDGV
jgi:hypothetical protein